MSDTNAWVRLNARADAAWREEMIDKPAREAKAREAARVATFVDAWQRAEAGELAGFQELVRLHAERLSIRVVIEPTLPDGVKGHADWRRRLIHVLPIDSEDRVAVALHEISHILAGECSRQAPHERDVRERRWWHCAECERLAWAGALDLAPFTDRMLRYAQRSLKVTRGWPAPAEARGAIVMATGSLARAQYRQRRRDGQFRRERQAAAMRR